MWNAVVKCMGNCCWWPTSPATTRPEEVTESTPLIRNSQKMDRAQTILFSGSTTKRHRVELVLLDRKLKKIPSAERLTHLNLAAQSLARNTTSRAHLLAAVKYWEEAQSLDPSNAFYYQRKIAHLKPMLGRQRSASL